MRMEIIRSRHMHAHARTHARTHAPSHARYQVWVSKIFGYDIKNASHLLDLSLPISEETARVITVRPSIVKKIVGSVIGVIAALSLAAVFWYVKKNPDRLAVREVYIVARLF